jgi:hypothetical protein
MIDYHRNHFFLSKTQVDSAFVVFPPTFKNNLKVPENFTNNLCNIKFVNAFRVAVPVRNPTPVYQSSASSYSASLNTNNTPTV